VIRAELDGPVGRLTLCRPEKRNALSAAMVDDAIGALDHFAASGARVALLDAEGPVFCAGADVAEARTDLHAPSFERLVLSIARPDLFVIALVRGPALGAGVALCAAAPVVVCAASAWLSLPERSLGLYPSLVIAYIEASVGPRRALQLGMSGDRLSPAEARDLGLVTDVVDADDIDEAACRWVALALADETVTTDACLGWSARYQSAAFTERRAVLGRIISR
jgi:enoyl-CoA hydratase